MAMAVLDMATGMVRVQCQGRGSSSGQEAKNIESEGTSTELTIASAELTNDTELILGNDISAASVRGEDTSTGNVLCAQVYGNVSCVHE